MQEPVVTPEPGVTQDEKTMAVLAHALGFFTGFLGPLIIYLVKKDSRFVAFHSLQALFFQLVVIAVSIVSGLLVAVLVGCVMAVAVLVADIYFVVMAATASSRGEWYEYPLAGKWARSSVGV